MKKYTFYSNDKIVIIFYILMALLTYFTMYEEILPSQYFIVFIVYIGVIFFISKEDNFENFLIFMQIPTSMVIYSLLPAFIEKKKIGEKFIEYGGTMANPVESEGYAPVYDYSIHINMSNINYGFLIEAFIVTVVLLLLHYRIIEIKKMDYY